MKTIPLLLVALAAYLHRGLPWTIAHEMVHTQQNYPWLGSMTGGPKFLRGTLLRQSITEGSADFIAELLTGQPKRNTYAESHEAELWRQFRITKSYYERAADKRQAIQEILTIRNFDRFLAASHYNGGAIDSSASTARNAVRPSL